MKRMQPLQSRTAGDTGHSQDLLSASKPRTQQRAGINGAPIDDNGTCAALGTVAAEIAVGQAQLVVHRFPQALAQVNADVFFNSIDIQRDSSRSDRSRRQRRLGLCHHG